MKRKILLFSCALAGLSIFLTAFFLYFVAYRNYTQVIHREIVAESSYIQKGIELSGMKYLMAIDPASFGHRITFIKSDGTVLFDSILDSNEMENHLYLPEVASALQNGVGESIRYSDGIDKKTYYYAARLPNKSILRLSVTTDRVEASLFRFIPLIFAIGIGVFLLVIFIGRRVARKLVQPINAIDLDNPEENVVYEELTPLLSRLKWQKDVIANQMAFFHQKQIEFTAITDCMREGFLVLGKEGQVLSYNKSALQFLHVHLENPIHQNVLSLHRSEAFRTTIESAISGTAAEALLAIENHYYQIYANPVVDNQQIQGTVVLLIDVTEREEREKLRREFTANVSHELKTPLTSISGYAEIIANGLVKSEDVSRFANNIYLEAQRLITLVGDILLLSKLDEKSLSLLRQTVNLYELTTEIVSCFSKASQSRQIEISVEGEAVELIAIREVLSEMIFNLLDNAIKYNVEGGKVFIKIAKTSSEISFCISDTGKGVPEHEKERILERFYRGEDSRNQQIEGTGLGLSIVKHGAILHNATIEIQSDGKSGTTMTLHFPVRT